MNSHELLKFYFGPATIVVTHIHGNKCDCPINYIDQIEEKKRSGSFQFKITRDGSEIFKKTYTETSYPEQSSKNIDYNHSFSINSDSNRVLLSFSKNDRKQAEVGIRFETCRLSLVQNIDEKSPPTPPSPPCSPPSPKDEIVTFSYIGSDQFYTVPSDVKSVIVECWGAGGATQGATGGPYVYYSSGSAGGGGYTKASLENISGQNFKVVVGGGGISGSAGKTAPATYGGGGSQFGTDPNWGTASGGGRSAIQLISGGIYNDVITAGGGGGAGVVQNSSAYPGYCAGGAGGSNMQKHNDTIIFGNGGDAENNTLTSQHGGTGGTQDFGGTNGVAEYTDTAVTTQPVNATQYMGGGNSVYGAGGGGGWYGGGFGGIVENASGGSTTPVDASSLVLWYDASDSSSLVTSGSLTTGSVVTQWNDKSKSKANLLPFVASNIDGVNITYNATGMNGRPAISLSETSFQTPLATGIFANGFTFFVVFSSVGDQSYNTLISRNDANNSSYPGPWEIHNNYVYIGNSSVNGIANGTTNAAFTLATKINPSIAILQASSSSPVNYYINNNLYTNNELEKNYQDTGDHFYVGSRADELTSFNGMMSEIMVFNAVMTLAQIQKVQDYLSKKWGIDFNADDGDTSAIGSRSSWLMGGGGGGSSHINVTHAKPLDMKQASGHTVANNSSLPTSVQGTIGNGATATNVLAVGANGQNGYVKITLKR